MKEVGLLCIKWLLEGVLCEFVFVKKINLSLGLSFFFSYVVNLLDSFNLFNYCGYWFFYIKMRDLDDVVFKVFCKFIII